MKALATLVMTGAVIGIALAAFCLLVVHDPITARGMDLVSGQAALGSAQSGARAG